MIKHILRLPAVLAVRGKSRSGHYVDIALGLYTRPVKIGPRGAGWPDNEVAALQAATIGGMVPEELRKLVSALTAQRAADAGMAARLPGSKRGAEAVTIGAQEHAQ